MIYIFFKPDTLQIMGSSTDPHSMQFPSVESEIEYHSLGNLGIEEVDGEYKLKVVKGYL